MKITACLPILALFVLTSCSTMTDSSVSSPQKLNNSPPETVLVTYQVKAGKEQEFHSAMSRAWSIYQSEHLVHPQPHVIVQKRMENGSLWVTEIFTWVTHDAPEHAPASVLKIWGEMHNLCEARGGHNGIQGGEVELVTP